MRLTMGTEGTLVGGGLDTGIPTELAPSGRCSVVTVAVVLDHDSGRLNVGSMERGSTWAVFAADGAPEPDCVVLDSTSNAPGLAAAAPCSVVVPIASVPVVAGGKGSCGGGTHHSRGIVIEC